MKFISKCEILKKINQVLTKFRTKLFFFKKRKRNKKTKREAGREKKGGRKAERKTCYICNSIQYTKIPENQYILGSRKYMDGLVQ